MKYDGHVKLTAKALEKFKQNCPIATNVCNAPMFKDTIRVWLDDKDTSNSADNYSSGVLNYAIHSITPDILAQVTLPDAVSFVDITERWTHEAPKGQRYHFMRASGESQFQAYLNGINFIKKHTENWVAAAKLSIQENKIQQKPLQNATWRNTRAYVKELALALHCLQDSYSPGHVNR